VNQGEAIGSCKVLSSKIVEDEDQKPRIIETFDAGFKSFIAKTQVLDKLFLHHKNQPKRCGEINLAENFAFWKQEEDVVIG